jgi:hypothetical protein
MQQNSTFDRLVSELSAEERIEMLKDIESNVTIDEEPLLKSSESEYEVNIEGEYRKLGFIKKFFLFIKSILRQRDVVDVFEDSLMKSIAEDVERASKGIFDSRRRTLSAGFADEIKCLGDSLSVFVEPLSRAFGAEKTEFVSFLAGFEIPLHQERLLDITNPENCAKGSSNAADSDVGRQMFLDVAAALKEISESDRSEVYSHVRSLAFLSELVFFPFANILEHYDETQSGEGVSLGLIGNSLIELGDVLFTLGRPPKQNALKALFLFDTENDEGTDPEMLADVFKKSIEDAYDGIGRIRRFANLLPYRKLLKLCTGNIGYAPEGIGGGEDWFSMYRKFWEERAESAVEAYIYDRKRRELLSNANDLLGSYEIPSLTNYTSHSLDDSLRASYETTLAFVKQFVEKLFLVEMHRVLKIFLVDADFYKPQNRQQFTDAYNGLRTAAREIAALEADLSKEGDIGKEIEKHRGSLEPGTNLPNHLAGMLNTVDIRAERIINSVRDNLGLMINVIKGILYGESGGRFDTLANISYIGGSENAKLLERLEGTLKQAEEARRIINEFFDMERENSR